MELQTRLAEFARANTKVFAISYDPVSVLTQFAEQYGIEYALLSDEGSEVITRLGLLNRHLAEQSAYSGRPLNPNHAGIPYPGLFLLDERGSIVDKQFEQVHQPRPAPDLILEDLLPEDELPKAITAETTGTAIQVAAWLGAATYRPMQRLHLHVALAIGPGMHVYAEPITEGFTPLRIGIVPREGLATEPTWLPEPHALRVAGIDQDFMVYAGQISTIIPLQLASNLGETPLAVEVTYQACNATECFVPETLTMALTLQGLDNLRPEPRSP